MELEETLQKLCQEIELEESSIVKEEHGIRFNLDEDMLINIKDLRPGFSLNAEIADAPEVKREDFFAELLEANLFGQATGGIEGGVIGLNPDQKKLILSLEIPYEYSYQDFRNAMEDFANWLDYWRSQVEEHKKKSDAAKGMMF